jgi:DNA-binding SARP family transcriptional activator
LERERSLAFPLLAHYLASPNPAVAALSNQLLALLGKVPPPPLSITTLGKFELLQSRRQLHEAAWRQRKAGELFRILLISPRRTALREQVFQALWPDTAPASVQSSFHQATSALRKALEPDLPEKFPSRYLQVEHGEISLHLPAGSQVDLDTFSQLIASHAWAAALELYQGDLFPGDLYAEWSVELREAIRQQALDAALALAREKAAAGDAPAALAASRQALSIEPWQEEAARIAMQSMIKTNHRVAAIRLYQQLARSLQDELGVQPGPELQALYRSLL